VKRLLLPGWERYDVRRDPNDHRLDPVAPGASEKFHAVRVFEGRLAEGATPVVMEGVALCGAVVRLVANREFDFGAEAACQACVTRAYGGKRMK